MTALNINDLNNGKKDLDHIAAVATSTTPTVMDRMGNIKDTVKGAVDTLKAFNSRGAWAAATAYAVKDVVSASGTWYVCVVAHVSSATFATDGAKWRVHQGASLAGAETLENKSFKGAVGFYTNGSRIGITGGAAPIVPSALVNVVNENVSTCALRVTSKWTGSTAQPYQNNDDSLWETFNKVTSNSSNFSWSISAPNAYNDIPAGVRDGGERVGVYGWATSVSIPGSYVHAGALASQIGVRGRAGFQNVSPASAVIESAIGVKGEIYGESAGSTIQNSFAGHFSCVDPGSTVLNNMAVYAAARGGQASNFSFFGEAGKLFNREQGIFGQSITATQSDALVSVRGGNGIEFGNPDPTGYGSNLGATSPSGIPFLAFCAEADVSSNTFRTRGKKGVLTYTDLTGRLIFGRLANGNAAGQAPIEMAAFSADGHLTLAETPYLRSKTVQNAGAPGVQGELAWDADFIYVCVAPNTWKRSALASW